MIVAYLRVSTGKQLLENKKKKSPLSPKTETWS